MSAMRPLDLAFEFREAGRGAMLQWQSPRVNNPRDPLFWQPLRPEVCFIKALVTGSRPDSVIYVKSTAGHQDDRCWIMDT